MRVPGSRVIGVALLLLWMASFSAGGTVMKLETPRLSIHYDSRLRRQISWQGSEGRHLIAYDPGAQEGLIISGQEINSFQFDSARSSQKRVSDPEFGPALEALVVGVFPEGGEEPLVERQTRIILPDQFPDVAIYQTRYRNLSSRTLHIDGVYSQRLVLDRKLTEPGSPPYSLTSFQGGAYAWGKEYALIPLIPGFKQSNFMGVGDVRGSEGVGGGMPFIDVWGPEMGVALVHLEKKPQWLSLPVEVRADERVEMAIAENPSRKLGQQEWIKPAETYETVMTAVILHRLDFYNPLHIYGQLLRKRGIAIPETSPAYAYEPYWKTWGFGRDFTVDKVLKILPELKSMGILIANLDDGWYDFFGDWQVNRSPGKFPRGEADMIDFVAKVHQAGMKTNLWWYPLGVDPKSRLRKEHPELLVQDENGDYPLDIENLYQLCPAYPPSLAHIRAILTRAISVWGYDGIYTDFQGLSAVPACFNPAHHHQTPLDGFQSMPKLFEMIYTTLHQLKSDPSHEVCICALPHSPYNMPYYDIATASDPRSPRQMRIRVKLEKAIRGSTVAVGDCYQNPIQEWTGSGVPESLESAMGTGAQMTTFYRELTEKQRTHWIRWFHEYRDLGLSSGEYLNLYDLAYDKPEAHVIRKGGGLFFGFFADYWSSRTPIELRGLDRATTYEVYDYANQKILGRIKGAEPVLKVGFKDSLLLRVRPVAAN